MSAPEGPVADPGKRQGEGLEKDVLVTRPGRWNRETCQYTVYQSHEREEKKEVQDGKDLKEALDSIKTQSKSNAVERVPTERISGNFRGRQTVLNGLY